MYIIDAIEPDDIETFSTCCKLMYSLTRHRIQEHKEKKSLFSKLFVEDYFLPFPKLLRDEKYGRPDTYLKEFFSDERNRLYPKDMVVGIVQDGSSPIQQYGDVRTARTPANYDEIYQGLDEFEHQLKSKMTEVHSMINLEIGGIEAEDWDEHFKAGYPLATFLLLLALLPNLEQLKIEDFSLIGQTLSANYSKIARLMIEAALGQEENGLGFGGRLSKCTIECDCGEGVGESLLPFIMMLPRMQTVQGFSLAISNGSWPFTDAVSPVVDLDLQGAIDTVTLSNYVRGIRELKRFRYTYNGAPEVDWEPYGIVATLTQSASRSLVHLDLTTSGAFEMDWWSDTAPGIGSLRSFEVLETVRLHYILLFEEVQTIDSAAKVYSAEILGDLFNKSLVIKQILIDNSLVKEQTLNDKSLFAVQILIDFLPSSVRTFQLDGIVKAEFIFDTFEGFPEHRVERLPNLELISLDAGDKFNSQIEKICKEAGVQMELSQDNSIFPDISE